MTHPILFADVAESKTCVECDEAKPLCEFYSRGDGRGLMARCKACKNEADRGWYQKNKERRNATNRERYQKNKERYNATSREWRRKNKDRLNAASREWRESNPDSASTAARRSKLRRRYGLEEADYNALMERQGGVCAVCGVAPNGIGLCVDHDHHSGFIRGLLCRPCNTAIGYFERMVPALPKVLAYLMSPPALEMNGHRVKNPRTR